MRSSSQQPPGHNSSSLLQPRFEDVLRERLEKQNEWLRKYEDIPLIDDTSRTYKELCEGLIPQEDFFVDQLQELSSKFQGHYMTKMNKQLKSEKEQLEKLKNEMTSQIKLLVDQNNHKHKELVQLSEELETQARANKHLNLMVEKLKAQLDEYKQRNDELNYHNISHQDYVMKSSDSSVVQQSLERQLRQRIDELQEKEAIIKEKEQENRILQQEIERFINENGDTERISYDSFNTVPDRKDRQSFGSSNNKATHQQNHDKKLQELMIQHEEQLFNKEQELKEVVNKLRAKEALIEMYQKRDQTTENTLNFQIEQEQKYQDIVRQYHLLETDWKSMENYIKGLNEYQLHVEGKYSLLLEQFQQVITELEEQKVLITQELQEEFQGLLQEKEQEIKEVKEQIQQLKSEQQEPYQAQSPQSTSHQEEVDTLRDFEQRTQKIEESYNQAIQQRDAYIQELQGQIQELQAQISDQQQQIVESMQSQQQQIIEQIQAQYQKHEQDIINRKDKEISELQKTKETNQKIIIQLEKQLKKTNSSASTQAQNTVVVKKEIELMQRQIEQKERENEELRRMRIQDNKEIQTLRRELTDLKAKLSDQELKLLQHSQNQNQSQQDLKQLSTLDFQYDLNEIDFYLKEMKEVKDRVLASILNAKAFTGCDLQKSSGSNGDNNNAKEDFSLSVEMDNDSDEDGRRSLQIAKDIVRKELEHLIILNSHSLDLQTLLQEKQTSLSPLLTQQHKQSQQQYQLDKVCMRLKSLFDQCQNFSGNSPGRNFTTINNNNNHYHHPSFDGGVIINITGSNDPNNRSGFDLGSNTVIEHKVPTLNNVEDIVDQVIATYEILQEENKLLIKEREFYNEHNLKKFVKEIEEHKIEIMRLKEQLKQAKLDEHVKNQDLDRQILEKSQQYSKDVMKLSTSNDQLLQRNNALTNELKQVLQQIEVQADQSEKLQYENLFLKKKLDQQLLVQQQSSSVTQNNTAAQSINGTDRGSSRDNRGVVSGQAVASSNASQPFQLPQVIHCHQNQQKQYLNSRKNSRKNSYSPVRNFKIQQQLQDQQQDLMAAKSDEYRKYQHKGRVDSPEVRGNHNKYPNTNYILPQHDTISAEDLKNQRLCSPICANNADNNAIFTEPNEPSSKNIFAHALSHHQSVLSNAKKSSVMSTGNTNRNIGSQRSGYASIKDEENEKLNSLIDEYRKENERCSQKIQELQDKLHTTSSKFFKEREVQEQLHFSNRQHNNRNKNNSHINGGTNQFQSALHTNDGIPNSKRSSNQSHHLLYQQQNQSMHNGHHQQSFNFQSETHHSHQYSHRLGGTGTYSNSTKNLLAFQTLPERDTSSSLSGILSQQQQQQQQQPIPGTHQHQQSMSERYFSPPKSQAPNNNTCGGSFTTGQGTFKHPQTQISGLQNMQQQQKPKQYSGSFAYGPANQGVSVKDQLSSSGSLVIQAFNSKQQQPQNQSKDFLIMTGGSNSSGMNLMSNNNKNSGRFSAQQQYQFPSFQNHQHSQQQQQQQQKPVNLKQATRSGARLLK